MRRGTPDSSNGTPGPAPDTPADGPGDPRRPGRRQFFGYLVAAPLLVTAAGLGKDIAGGNPLGGLTGLVTNPVGAVLGGTSPASMTPIPSAPQPADVTDLGDVLILASALTDALVTVTVRRDGKVDFVMPREENGQGLRTGVAMIIADEMDVALSDVNVTLADAEPKLLFNQITGGSSGIRTMYNPVRTAAALARANLLAAAARQWGVSPSSLTVADGVVHGPGGRSATYGQLSPLAAASTTRQAPATPKDPSQYRIVGTPVSQLANFDIVTGREKYATDLDIPGAKPTMVRRAPTQRGTLKSFRNPSAIRAMPGVLDVAALPFGVAVRAETFGQAIDAVNAVDATFAPGPVAEEDDESIFAKLKAAALPLAVPKLPSGVSLADVQTVEAEFEWAYVNHAPLEPNVAVADVRPDRAEIWAPLQNPIVTLQTIAKDAGLPQDAVTVHVIRGGGSFGRTLWFDAAHDAALISKAMGKPVKLMWHRTNDMRQGRGHPHSYHRLRATVLGGSVLSYEQRVSSVQSDINPGLGEIFTYEVNKLPVGETGFDQTLFLTTVTCPYNFGVVDELLDEVNLRFWTSSWRSVYSYATRCSEEILVDKLAAAMKQDPLAFRLAFLKDDRIKTLLRKVAEVGNWGRTMPRGHAQGICANTRDRSYGASLVEIDATDPAKPRVTKAVIAVDAVLPINPRSIEGQQIGGLSDAIGVVLSASSQVRNGLPLNSGWDDFGWPVQGNYPTDVQVIVMPRDGDTPGGIGESGVPNTAGAIANAYIRATGTMPARFPVNPVTIVNPTPPGMLHPSPKLPLPSPGDPYNY